ncbi:MAG: hypothetical protein DMF70_04950, partial [Acidobacteria bacterium]
MKTELKEISPTRKQIDVVIEPEAVRAVYDRITDQYTKGANVPGFRPGHAPRGVVRTRFKDQIRTELLRELLPDAVQKAVEEHQLAPLGEPELNLENSEGLSELGQKPISFTVNVEVLPDIKLGDYKAVYDRISDKYAKGANVPGFRPGHAPRGVVRTRFKDQIRTELLRELLPDAVQKAVEEHKLAPLGEPELNLENSEGLSELGEKPISFSVNVEVLPDIKLGDYKGLEVARRTRPVNDEDLDRVIESLRENSATLEPVEDRGARPGDTVTANFYGK